MMGSNHLSVKTCCKYPKIFSNIKKITGPAGTVVRTRIFPLQSQLLGLSVANGNWDVY